MKNKINELEALSKKLDKKIAVAYLILAGLIIVTGILLITIGYLLKHQIK